MILQLVGISPTILYNKNVTDFLESKTTQVLLLKWNTNILLIIIFNTYIEQYMKEVSYNITRSLSEIAKKKKKSYYEYKKNT